MSRRHTSSGSRFQPLHVEGEDEEEEDDVFASSTEEMNLSRDFYPASIPGARRSSGPATPIGGMTSSRKLYQTGTPISHAGSHQRQSLRSIHSSSSESSAGVMKLSRDFDPAPFPQQPTQIADPGRNRPQTIGAGGSGLQNLWKIKPRSVSSKPSAPEEQSGLDFVWDHYRRDSNPFDDVGEDALGDVFGQNTADSEEEKISPNIENDVLILRSIGFNIDYPKGMLGEGFYGVVYKGHYGSDVSFTIEFCSKIF